MKLNWNHPILVSSHAITNCTDTLLIGMLLRTIVEKEKSRGTVKRSQQEKVNDVYIDGGHRRGVGPSFYPSVGEGGEAEATSSYSPLRGHHPSITNLRLGPWPLFILLYGELLLESRDSSCLEKSNQLPFSDATALHPALSGEKQYPSQRSKAWGSRSGWHVGAEIRWLVEVSCRKDNKQSKEWNLEENNMRSYAKLKKLQSYKES